MTESARQAQRETRGFTAEQLAAAKAVSGGSREYEILNQKLDQLRDREIAAAQAAARLAQAQATAGAAGETAKKGADSHGKSLHGLSFASGQAAREYAVLINEFQRGDFTRLQGSLITLANRVNLMPLLFSAAGAAWASAAVILGSVAVAAAKGASEQANYNRVLIATGNISGTSYGEALNMARGMVSLTTSVGEAKEAITAMVATGHDFHDNLREVSQGVIDFSHVMGTTVEEAAKEFEKLRDNPVRAIEEVNKSMHFLTLEVRDQIRTLQEHGQVEQAAALAEATLAEAMKTRAAGVEQNLGYLQKRWNELRIAASSAWDAMLGMGRDATMNDNLKAATERMQKLQASVRNADPRMQNRAGQDVAADWAQAIRIPHSGDDFHFYTVELNKQIALVNTLSGAVKKQGEEAKAGQGGASQATLENTAAMHAQLLSIDRLAQRTNELAKVKAMYEQAAKDGTLNAKDSEFTDANKARLIADIEHRYRDYRTARVAATEAEKAAKRELQEHDAELDRTGKSIEEHRALVDAQANSDTKLTEVQRWATKSLADLASAQSHLTEKEKEGQRQEIASITAKDALNQAQAAQNKLFDEGAKALDRMARAGRARATEAERELNSIGHGSEQNDLSNRINRIQDAAAGERDRINTQAIADHAEYTDAVLKDIADIDRAEQGQINEELRYHQQRQQAMGDWRNGAQRAWEEFQSRANDVAGQTYDSFQTAFSGMESAIDQFARTGKFKFSDFARTVLAELAKIELRILLSKILTSMFGAAMSSGAGAGDATGGSTAGIGSYNPYGTGAGGTLQPAANGGILQGATLFPLANGTGLAGENGFEGLLPLAQMAGGRLGVHATGGGNSPINVNTTVVLQSNGAATSNTTSDGDSAQAKMLGELVTNRVKEILNQEQRQGGILWRMTQS